MMSRQTANSEGVLIFLRIGDLRGALGENARREHSVDAGKNTVDLEVSQAAMMAAGAGALLAGAAVDADLQVLGQIVMGFAPGDMRRAEQRDDRHVERLSEMARTGIRGDEQLAVADGGFGQSETEVFIGQAEDFRAGGFADDHAHIVPLGRAADDEHGFVELIDDPLRERREVFHGPVLGGTKRAAGVETDDPARSKFG